MVGTCGAFQRCIHLQFKAVDLAGSFHAADLVIVSVGGHGRTGSQLLAPLITINGVSHFGVKQAFGVELAQECEVFFALIINCASKEILVVVIIAQNVRAIGAVFAHADAEGRHRHTEQNAGTSQNGERVRIGIISFVSLQDLVQVIKGLGGFQTLGFQIILTQDQAAIVERLIGQRRHIVALAVLQVQHIHIVLQVHFLNAGVEVGGPVAVVADGNQSAVQSQRSILTGGGLVQDDIGNVLAGIQCQRNLGRVVRNRNGLNVQVDVAALLHFGKGEPVFFIRKGSIIRQINSDVDGVLIGVIRGAGFGGSGSGICGRLSCAGSDRGRTAASTGGQSACCHAGGQSHGQGTAD